MNIPYVFKKCNKCGEWLVACKVNFHKQKRYKYGLKSICRKCEAEYKKQYRKENKDKIAEYKKRYYKDNKDKITEINKQYYKDNKDKIIEQHKQYYKDNKDKIAEHKKEYQKQYREDNKNKIAEHYKQYYEDNKDKIAEYQKEYKKQYREDNKDKIAEYQKQYRENNKDKIKQYREDNKDKIAERNKQYYSTPQGQVVAFNKRCRRRTREQNQGNGITKEQWFEMMSYFNWECAYSGEYIGNKENKSIRSIDHIIPLNSGGEHEIWNLVPMYRPYNSSKNDKDMLEWYKEQPFFSEERLQKIYEWQEYAFNKWHKEEII